MPAPDAIDYASPRTPPVLRTSRFALAALALAVATSPLGAVVLSLMSSLGTKSRLESALGFPGLLLLFLVGLPLISLCVSIAALARVTESRGLRGKWIAIASIIVNGLSMLAGGLLTFALLEAAA